MDGKLFTAMSMAELSDLHQAKTDMSARFLKPVMGVAMAAGALLPS